MLSGLFLFRGDKTVIDLRCKRLALPYALLLAAIVGSGGGALGQPSPSRVAPANNGLWFQVKAAIKPVAMPKEQGIEKGEPHAALSVQLRISSHADGSHFFGHPSQKFDFKLADGSQEKLYWQDSACHPRRGLPKISVVAIDGTIERDGRSEDIKARPRQVGVKLPSDEITPGSALARSSVGQRQALTFQASTKISKIDVLVKIYTVDCAL